MIDYIKWWEHPREEEITWPDRKTDGDSEILLCFYKTCFLENYLNPSWGHTPRSKDLPPFKGPTTKLVTKLWIHKPLGYDMNQIWMIATTNSTRNKGFQIFSMLIVKRVLNVFFEALYIPMSVCIFQCIYFWRPSLPSTLLPANPQLVQKSLSGTWCMLGYPHLLLRQPLLLRDFVILNCLWLFWDC